jgi:hypothetical protein
MLDVPKNSKTEKSAYVLSERVQLLSILSAIHLGG